MSGQQEKAKQSRRNFIKPAGAGLLLPLSSSVLAKSSATSLNSFVVPPLNTGVRKGNKVSYKLSINSGKTEFFRGVNTPTLGLNQNYLGSVLCVKCGDTVSIKVENYINEVTTGRSRWYVPHQWGKHGHQAH